jgi:hypothetical protein
MGPGGIQVYPTLRLRAARMGPCPLGEPKPV